MRKTLLISTAIAMGVCTSTAMAKPGAYIGIKGGYNHMSFTRTITTNGLKLPAAPTTANGNTFETKSSRYFGNIHIGYLFPITKHMQIGPQVGYSNYGNAEIDNKDNAIARDSVPGILQYGKAVLNFNSLNLSFVSQYAWGNYFVQGRAGLYYMFATTSSDKYATGIPSIGQYVKAIEAKDTFDPALGISVGGYLSKHFSISFSYDHIFGKNYKGSDFNDMGDYNVPTQLEAPAMDLVGIQLSYHF